MTAGIFQTAFEKEYPMKIIPLPALDDNYIWLIDNGSEAVCIDPGDAAPVSDYLQQRRLKLRQIWITHHHGDHTAGIAALRRVFPDCVVYGGSDINERTQEVADGSEIAFADGIARVRHTPGHTANHLSYFWQQGGKTHVFCGDTLFSAGCGRIFTGTAEQLYRSLQDFASLPDDTLFYPAHEYTASNLRFAAAVEPHNADIRTASGAAAGTPTLPVTLAHEKRINPFLRTAEPAVRQAAEEQGAADGSGLAVFAALREWKNRF